MTFPDRATYLSFWKEHPAFAGEELSQVVLDYVSYDLTGTEPHLRPAASLEAVRQDSMDLYGGGVVLEALDELRRDGQRGATVSLMTAPRGLLNQTPGLYSPSAIEGWRADLPNVPMWEVPDVNHYTIVMGETGARTVAREVARLVGAPRV
jgi:hypothetical protein